MFKGSWRALLGGTPGEDGHPLGGSLGPLEREVMDVVWRRERVSVREVRAELARPAAYTTVMTTLDRLYKKGLLDRIRDGRAFVYRAPFSRQDVEAAIAARLLRGALEGGADGARPLLSNLVDVIGDRDGALLDDLEELVRRKREQIRQG